MPYCAHCGTQVAQVSYAPCPKCGNPTNGAPRPPVKPGTKAPVVLIVIIGIVFLVAILGIVAAIAIPNMLTAVQRAKQKRTMADQRSIAIALEAYATYKNRYPDPQSLEQELAPTYIRQLPKTDGWTNPFRYECWSTTGGDVCDAYAIGSGGRDGTFEREALRDYEGSGATTGFDGDIVFSNGIFVQYPKGTQGGS